MSYLTKEQVQAAVDTLDLSKLPVPLEVEVCDRLGVGYIRACAWVEPVPNVSRYRPRQDGKIDVRGLGMDSFKSPSEVVAWVTMAALSLACHETLEWLHVKGKTHDPRHINPHSVVQSDLAQQVVNIVPHVFKVLSGDTIVSALTILFGLDIAERIVKPWPEPVNAVVKVTDTSYGKAILPEP